MNDIGVKGACRVAEALEKHSSLKHMGMGSKKIGVKGFC